jgi:predicted flap endonuclease-1-like 5' DNA nuclease
MYLGMHGRIGGNRERIIVLVTVISGEHTMASIKDIEGIGAAKAAKLAEAGIRTTEKLLEVAADKKGRATLSADTGLNEKELLEWVNRADLFRVKGIGEEFSDLLEAAGVDSPSELATRNAENLQVALEEINSKKKIVRRVPTAVEISKLIAEAKTLPKVVTH